MCYLRIIQRIYIAVRHRTDRGTYLLRFPDGAFHAPYYRADLLVDGTFPAEFLLLQIIAGMVVTFSLRDLRNVRS